MNSALRVSRIRHRCWVGLCLATALVLAVPSKSGAEITETETDSIELPGGGVGYASPAIADIDANPSNGLEIAAAGSDGMLHVVGADGSVRWSVKLPNYSCSDLSSTNKLLSSPAVGALMGNGVPYVVVGYGGLGGAACDGGVAAYRGSDGKKAWVFSIKAFAKKERFYAYLNTVFSTPALADVDGDGKLEIGFGGFDRNVYLLNSNGKVRWYYNAADTVWSSPSFANINRDRNLEMIIGTDISKNDKINPPTIDGGYVLAFKTGPQSPLKIAFRDPTKRALVWSKSFNQVVFSSPVTGDLLPGRKGLETVIGSGCYFPEGTSSKRGNEFRVMDAQRGRVLSTLSTTICSPSSAAVGDLDNDGIPEVVVTVSGEPQWGGDGQGRVMAWNPTTGQTLWTTVLPAMFPFQSAVIADFDRNGTPEIAVASAGSVHILSGQTGEQLLRLRVNGTMQGTPAAADIDQDGLLDLVAAGARGANAGVVHIFRGFTNSETTAVRTTSESLVWPQWRGTSARTGSK
jgi:hypothetical protein